MFGVIPAYGFYVRHVRGVVFDNIDVSFDRNDERPAIILDDVKDVSFHRTRARLAPEAKMFVLRNVTNFTSLNMAGRDNIRVDRAEQRSY